MGTINLKYKNEELLTKTFELPYYCKHKLADMYYKILSEKETVKYTEKSIGYYGTDFIDFSELIEISESEFEAFASETEKFILAKLNKTI